jgi:nucleoside-diphosphate-sugar epimerase
MPVRERMPRDDHPNFYRVQEDHVREHGVTAGYDWTIMRPGDIHGPGYSVSFNKIPVIGTFAAICRDRGLEFGFPGGAQTLRQATDVGLLARAIRWAALAPNASNEIFNVTNGGVFTWRDVWPAIGATLGVDVAEDTPRKLSESLPSTVTLVERTLGWLLSYKRLALRYDRTVATITALDRLAVTLICARRLPTD